MIYQQQSKVGTVKTSKQLEQSRSELAKEYGDLSKSWEINRALEEGKKKLEEQLQKALIDLKHSRDPVMQKLAEEVVSTLREEQTRDLEHKMKIGEAVQHIS